MTIDEFMNFMRRKDEKPKTDATTTSEESTAAPRAVARPQRQDAGHGRDDNKFQRMWATTLLPPTTLDNIQRETGCKISQTKQEVTFLGSDFQIRACSVLCGITG